MKPYRIPKYVWRILLWGNVAVILWFWWQGSSTLLFSSLGGGLVALGKLSGLLAAGSVLLQFALMGRNVWVERTFGLDKLARIHARSGKRAFYFLVAHPILITLGYAELSQTSFIPQFLTFWFSYPYVWWAVLALVLFVVVIGTSIIIVRTKLPYELWYFVHLLVYLAVFLSFWHQINVGTDLLASRLFYGYWIALYAIVLGSQLIFRFMRPVYRLWRHQFQVSRVVRENYNTVSIYFTGRDLEKFDIYPGQFMILRFFNKTLWWQAHPFSLSRIPDGRQLRITPKAVGNYTRELPTLEVGTKVLIDGPYGIFTEWVSASPKVLFIAGGIGITPIRSLMERLLKKGREAVLLYANKTEQDIVFKQELEQVTAQHGGKIIHVLSDQPGYGGETGFIDEQKIQRLVPDAAERDIFLCGPPMMMKAITAALKKLGVPEERIHWERFALE